MSDSRPCNRCAKKSHEYPGCMFNGQYGYGFIDIKTIKHKPITCVDLVRYKNRLERLNKTFKVV